MTRLEKLVREHGYTSVDDLRENLEAAHHFGGDTGECADVALSLLDALASAPRLLDEVEWAAAWPEGAWTPMPEGEARRMANGSRHARLVYRKVTDWVDAPVQHIARAQARPPVDQWGCTEYVYLCTCGLRSGAQGTPEQAEAAARKHQAEA